MKQVRITRSVLSGATFNIRENSVKILITNDDGIMAPGLQRLARIAQEFGDVYVVAPDSQRSGVSHGINLHRPILCQPVCFPVEGVIAYSCDGTPADCIRVGTLNLVPGGADLILSGINNGFNVASDVQYSATVGAALEGAFQKVPSIAFSEESADHPEIANHYLKEILGELVGMSLGQNQIWNVNFPKGTVNDCKGILWDRVVSKDDFYKDRYEGSFLDNDVSGTIHFSVIGVRNWKGTAGTDLEAVLNGYISVGVISNLS